MPASSRITFTGSGGTQLAGRVDLPADGRPDAWALFAHCFTCSKDLRAVTHITRELNAHRIAVLRFDFTGLGESDGDFADTTFSSNVDDLVAAARYLETAHAAPTLLIGHSLGGAAVLQVASRLPSVTAVVTIGAPCSPEHVAGLFDDHAKEIQESGKATVTLAGRPFTIRKEFVEDLAAANMTSTIGQLNRALLILHSPVDKIVGIENAAHIFQTAKHPKSFVSLDDADHLLTHERDARYAATVIAAWATRYVERPIVTDGVVLTSRVVARIGDEGFRTELMAGGHGLVADEPVDVGGTDLGPTPYDLMAAALGACTAMTLRMYASRKEWPLEAVEVGVSHDRVHADDEAACEHRAGRVDRLQREILMTGPLDESQRARLLEIADRCPVHRTLDAGVRIETHAAAAPTP